MRFKDFYVLRERAFHGTPFKIEHKFDSKRIGSGEGNQVYGYGLYFAEEKNVAKQYKNIDPSSTQPPVYTFLGKELTPSSPQSHVASLLINSSISKVRKEVTRWLKTTPPEREKEIKHFSEMLTFLDGLRSKSEIKIKKPKGNLYEVEINVSSDDLLIWDENIKNQNPKVKKIFDNFFYPKTIPPLEAKQIIDYLIKRFEENSLDGIAITIDHDSKFYNSGMNYIKRILSPEELKKFIDSEESVGNFIVEKFKDYVFYHANSESGYFLYDKLKKELGTSKKASEYLLSKGIKGIKYKDGFSRVGKNSEKETMNYVIFDDSLITIVKENGKRFSYSSDMENKEFQSSGTLVHIEKTYK